MIKTKLLSACAVVGLLALTSPFLESASASSTSDGAFLVKAQNVQNPEKQSVAGVKANLKTGENNPGGDGGTTPEPENPDLGEDVGFPAVYSIDCGPMTFKIDSVELSYGNLAKELFEAGKKDEVVKNPGGWKYLIHTQDFSKYSLGLPADGVKDVAVALSDSPTSSIGGKAIGMQEGSETCMIEDRRVEKALSNKFHYSKYNESNYREGRFIEEEGKLIPVIVEIKNGEVIGISRLVMLDGGNAAYTESPSDVYPAFYSKLSSRESLVFRYKTVVDSLEYIYIENRADSSGYTRYEDGDKKTVKRENAPSVVEWNTQGSITKFEYLDANNAIKKLTVPSGVDPVFYYNQQTGQNWDGSYKKVSDFNIDAPFIPEKP